VTRRGPCWARCPRTTPFLPVRGQCTACDGLDSKPREASYNAAFGSGVQILRPALQIRVSRGGFLQYRHHDKRLQRTSKHAGLTRDYSQADFRRTAHRSRLYLGAMPADISRAPHRDSSSHTAVQTQPSSRASCASQTLMPRLLEPLQCFHCEPGVCSRGSSHLPCLPGRPLPCRALGLLLYPLVFANLLFLFLLLETCSCTVEVRRLARASIGSDANDAVLSVDFAIWSYVQRISDTCF
jgi:hypothetical protein